MGLVALAAAHAAREGGGLNEVVAATRERYVTAYEKLAGEPFSAWLDRVGAR